MEKALVSNMPNHLPGYEWDPKAIIAAAEAKGEESGQGTATAKLSMP